MALAWPKRAQERLTSLLLINIQQLVCRFFFTLRVSKLNVLSYHPVDAIFRSTRCKDVHICLLQLIVTIHNLDLFMDIKYFNRFLFYILDTFLSSSNFEFIPLF